MARILIIDDNETMREGLGATVRRMGHEAVLAASGAAGLAAFEKARPDFVITDLKMEGTGGLDVVKSVRERDPDCPVMIVTAFGSVETAVEAMRLGAFEFLQKPFAPEVVRLKVERARKLGRFELADKGTLFLDEIGDVTPALQLKLLRVLQEREFERVGGEETIKVDVRVVSATHRDIQAAVAVGTFREDLFYRLHVVPCHVPPLRERKEDIARLVAHFIAKLGPRTNAAVKGVSDVALARLVTYNWPGNVRELENVIEQALVFAESAE